MTIQTTIGKTYAITPTTDCTVLTPDGITITTAPAGEQTVFIAPTAEIEITDPSALVTETFKAAPAGYAAAGSLSSKQTAAVQTLIDTNLANHTTNTTIHITAAERTTWNAAADPSSLTAAIDARLRELGQVYVHFSATTFSIPGNGGSDTITVHTNSLEPLKRQNIPLTGYTVTETRGPNIYAYQTTTYYPTLSVGTVTQEITITQAAGPAYLDITPTTLPTTAAGQSFNLQATYNTKTTPSFSPPPSWITQGMIAFEQGTSTTRPCQATSYTITPNLTADQRTATITVTSGDTSKTCTITQDPATLHYEPDTTLIEAPAAGGDIQITFQVNTATDNPTFVPDEGESAYFGGGSWLTQKSVTSTTTDPDTGRRTVTITLTAESNLNGGIPREHLATFTLRNTTKTVTITQSNTES